jgi:hypothetical protein
LRDKPDMDKDQSLFKPSDIQAPEPQEQSAKPLSQLKAPESAKKVGK